MKWAKKNIYYTGAGGKRHRKSPMGIALKLQ